MKSSRLITLLLAVATATTMLCSCGDKHNCNISVQWNGASAPNSKAYLFDFITTEVVDSATVKNGRAAFHINVQEPTMMLVGSDNQQAQLQCIVAEEGAVSVIIEDQASKTIITGTALNDTLNAIFTTLDNGQASTKARDFIDSARMLDFDSLNEKDQETLSLTYIHLNMEAELEQIDIANRYYKTNKSTILGSWLYYMLTIWQYDTPLSPETARPLEPLTLASLDSMLALEPASISEYPPIQMLRSMLVGDETGTFIDFSGTDYATGHTVTLSKMVAGKVAVIDFWASWCAPCVEEIRSNLIPLYEQYKDKVAFVGVDINDEPDKHKAATERLGIPYAQIIDSKNMAIQLYNIQSVPYIVVVAADGSIVASGVRGSALAYAIEQALAL